MLAGACKQKPPSFLILLFVPKSGFLKRQAVTSAASGKPEFLFLGSAIGKDFSYQQNQTAFSGLKKFKIPALDKNRTQSSDKSEFTDT